MQRFQLGGVFSGAGVVFSDGFGGGSAINGRGGCISSGGGFVCCTSGAVVEQAESTRQHAARFPNDLNFMLHLRLDDANLLDAVAVLDDDALGYFGCFGSELCRFRFRLRFVGGKVGNGSARPLMLAPGNSDRAHDQNGNRRQNIEIHIEVSEMSGSVVRK